MSEIRTDEDRIIEVLVMENQKRKHEDADFLPIRQSLYNAETVVPVYDDDVSALIV